MANKKYPYYEVGEPTDLKELIKYCADTYGEKTAFRYKKKGEEIKISYKQLESDVNAIGTYLHGKGYRNAHIALIGENSYAWVVFYFAIVNGGNVVVPMDKESSAQDIQVLLEKSDADLLIHSDTYKDIAAFCGMESINMASFPDLLQQGQKLLDGGNKSFSETAVDNEKLCAVVFTSGTTDLPKGVMLNHRNLTKDLYISSKNLQLPGSTVALLPFYHTYGFMACVLCPMLKGFPIFINTSLKRAFDDIKYAQPKYVAVVPMILVAIYDKIWNGIKNQGKENAVRIAIKSSNILLNAGIDIKRKVFKQIHESFGGNLEMIICGGADLDKKYVKGFRDIGIQVTNGYGITECSPIVTTMRNKHYAPASVGAIQPEIEARIVDGEVQIKGPIVFMGYYKNSRATAEAFDGDWFKTGDLGHIDADGLLYITGRKKNLIILSNGKNVVPEELEALLLRNIPEVKEVLVYGADDSIIAEVYPDESIENVQTVIRNKTEQLNKKLPVYKQISSVQFRNTPFPKTTTKKIKRDSRGQQENV